MVEDQGGGQLEPGAGPQPVAQLDRGERVEAEVLKRPVPVNRGRLAIAEHDRHLGLDHLEEGPFAFVLSEAGETLSQLADVRSCRDLGPGDGSDQALPQRREGSSASGVAQHGHVEMHGH